MLPLVNVVAMFPRLFFVSVWRLAFFGLLSLCLGAEKYQVCFLGIIHSLVLLIEGHALSHYNLIYVILSRGL